MSLALQFKFLGCLYICGYQKHTLKLAFCVVKVTSPTACTMYCRGCLGRCCSACHMHSGCTAHLISCSGLLAMVIVSTHFSPLSAHTSHRQIYLSRRMTQQPQQQHVCHRSNEH
eukprot:jgi/Chrzof1/6551/Cz19g00230.t1